MMQANNFKSVFELLRCEQQKIEVKLENLDKQPLDNLTNTRLVMT